MQVISDSFARSSVCLMVHVRTHTHRRVSFQATFSHALELRVASGQNGLHPRMESEYRKRAERERDDITAKISSDIATLSLSLSLSGSRIRRPRIRHVRVTRTFCSRFYLTSYAPLCKEQTRSHDCHRLQDHTSSIISSLSLSLSHTMSQVCFIA